MTIGAACALAVPVDTGWCVQVTLLMDVGICHRQVQAMFDDAFSDIGLAIRLLRHDMTCVPRLQAGARKASVVCGRCLFASFALLKVGRTVSKRVTQRSRFSVRSVLIPCMVVQVCRQRVSVFAQL